jgi:SecD/SecF fusion protein
VDYVRREKGKEVTSKLIVTKKVEITGDKVTSAGVGMGQMVDGRSTSLSIARGQDQFADVTARMAQNKNARERFAILMDKVVIQAAGLSQDAMAAGGIRGGSAQITGDFEEQEARNIASALLNPLENEVQIEEERGTSASLGEDAIRSGLFAGYICAALTLSHYIPLLSLRSALLRISHSWSLPSCSLGRWGCSAQC